MARIAEEVASILISMYGESFAGDSFGAFRIGWPELRSLAGVSRLDDEYLWEIDQELKESAYFLFPLDNFLLVVAESDLSYIRAVPPRVIEENLPGDDDDFDLPLFDDEDDELADREALESILSAHLSDKEPAPPETKAAPAAKSKKARKSKVSGKSGEMSE